MRLKRPCERCNKIFLPTSKRGKICNKCNQNENGTNPAFKMDKTNHKCEYCDETFRNKLNLVRHKRKYNDKKEIKKHTTTG